MTQQKITHCVFDCDGIVLDTEKLYFEVFDEYLKNYGARFDHKLQIQMMGRSPMSGMQLLVDRHEIPKTVEKVREEIDFLLEQKLPHCKSFPGAVKIIEHFKSRGIPMAMATGSNTFTYNLKTKNHKNILNLFEHVVLSDDPEVTESKPSPRIFQVAIDRFKQKPSSSKQVVVFEDSVNGALAAINAGTFVVFIPSIPIELIDPKILDDCDCVIESWEQFSPSILGLMPPENEDIFEYQS